MITYFTIWFPTNVLLWYIPCMFSDNCVCFEMDGKKMRARRSKKTQELLAAAAEFEDIVRSA